MEPGFRRPLSHTHGALEPAAYPARVRPARRGGSTSIKLDEPVDVLLFARPKTPKAREHRRALPYADVPAALVAVAASGAGPAAKAAIRFTALTAVRSGEARGATWGEVADSGANRSPIPEQIDH